MKPLRVIVTGSRDGAPYDVVRAELLLARGTQEAPPVLVVGDAAGVDAIARRCARAIGWSAEEYAADWDHGPKAGPIRNQAMVDSGADLCIAFPSPDSKGTWDCVRRAKAAGIPVRIVRIGGAK